VILTERELLVLRFLPSHLTNAEIARECFMSVNTVKANLKNIYAKLGVSTRGETVERARLLGLLYRPPAAHSRTLTRDPGTACRDIQPAPAFRIPRRCQRQAVTARRSLPGC